MNEYKGTRIQEYFPKKDITKISKNRNNHLKKIALIHHKDIPRFTNRQIHAHGSAKSKNT